MALGARKGGGSYTECRAGGCALQPKPWPVDRRAALDSLAAASFKTPANITWVSNGIDNGVAAEFTRRLQQLGAVTLLTDPITDTPVILAPARDPGPALTVLLHRLEGAATSYEITALAQDGRLLGRQTVLVDTADTTNRVEIDLPSELRNRAAQLQVEGENTAAAVVLLDERFRRRPVGLASGDTPDVDQPLLGDLFYLDRALGPFTEVRRGPVNDLLERQLAMLVLADIGTLTGDETNRVEEWVASGGILVRFAGPRLAEGGPHRSSARCRG